MKLYKISYNKNMKFQERFNEVLKICGKTQVDIAREIGVSQQGLSEYKAGRSVPSLEKLYKLCKYLDVSADYLLGLDDNY